MEPAGALPWFSNAVPDRSDPVRVLQLRRAVVGRRLDADADLHLLLDGDAAPGSDLASLSPRSGALGAAESGDRRREARHPRHRARFRQRGHRRRGHRRARHLRRHRPHGGHLGATRPARDAGRALQRPPCGVLEGRQSAAGLRCERRDGRRANVQGAERVPSHHQRQERQLRHHARGPERSVQHHRRRVLDRSQGRAPLPGRPFRPSSLRARARTAARSRRQRRARATPCPATTTSPTSAIRASTRSAPRARPTRRRSSPAPRSDSPSIALARGGARSRSSSARATRSWTASSCERRSKRRSTPPRAPPKSERRSACPPSPWRRRRASGCSAGTTEDCPPPRTRRSCSASS